LKLKTKNKEWLQKKITEINSLESYVPEKTNETLAKQYGFNADEIVKLNYNENLYLPKQKLVTLLKEVAEKSDLRIYPQEEESNLREAIGKYLKTQKDCIVIGNGSDELIDRATRFFLQKGDSALSVAPTFPIFKHCVKYQTAEYFGIPLQDNFAIDTKQMLDNFTSETKLLYLCSPNNPTANQFQLNEIEPLIEEFPGIVIVDEAYAEYAEYSAVPLIDKYENLIVLRTFSKAFGLASLRLGYAVCNPTLAQAFSKKPTPYPVSATSLSMGRKLLENIELVKESVKALKAERTKLIERLNKVNGRRAFKSDTNFVLFNVPKPYDQVYESLLKLGIVAKKSGRILQFENCLRTTVGLPEMNIKLLEALREILR
jgi:histidinol-phosphate aminotransferase